MPTADNSHQTKTRQLANKNIAVHHLLNLTSGIQGAMNPKASTYLRVVKGKNTTVSQGEFNRTEDDSVNTIYNQVFGITQVPRIPEWRYNSQSVFNQFTVSGPIAYGGGIWAILAINYTTFTSGLLTSSDPAGVWTVNTSITGSTSFLSSINYGNGIWVIAGYDTNGSIILTTTDPAGVWTNNTRTYPVNLKNVYYSNSTWVITTDTKILTTTDPAGVWTEHTIGISSVSNIHYGNGIWVLTGAIGSDSVILTATDPSGTWITNSQLFSEINSIFYGNGVWVISSINDSLVYTTTDPTGPWIPNTTVTFTPGALAFGGDTWISVAGNNIIYRTNNPSGLWIQDTSPALTIDAADSYLNTILYENNTFVTGGENEFNMILFTFST